jgi:hypothetical protein
MFRAVLFQGRRSATRTVALTASGNIGKVHGIGSAQGRRSFISVNNMARESAKKAVETSPTEENLLRYLQVSNMSGNSKEVIQTMEKGWNTGKIPVNEAFLKEYIKAAAQLKRLDSINISSLLAVLANGRTNAAEAGATALSNTEIAALIKNATAGSSAPGAGALAAGYSAEQPLHVIK